MQVGMAHYKLMEKADRDNSHAEAAEDEFRTFLVKYPQSPYVPQAEQSMRNVQEVLAEGEFGIARFYYIKEGLSRRPPPAWWKSPDAIRFSARATKRSGCWATFTSAPGKLSKNEDDKNHWADLAAQVLRPDRAGLSGVETWYPGAKERLKAMGMPIPA